MGGKRFNGGGGFPLPLIQQKERSMNISIIIPTHNRREMLKSALVSLQHQSYEGDKEIIVVVDGCTDGTADLLQSEFPDVRTVTFENNVGAAVGLNAGAKIAMGEILLFLDDDMEYQPELVRSHQQMHKEGPYDVIIGHFPLGNLPTSSFFRDVIHEWTEDWQCSFSENVSFYDALCSGHFSLKKDLYQAVGGFDENFSVWGRKDSELGFRLIQRGAMFGFCKAAQAVQNYEKSPSKFLADFELLGRADVDLYEKHPSTLESLLLSRYFQAPWIVMHLRQLCATDPSLISAVLPLIKHLFDRWHGEGLKGTLYEGLLWLAADLCYWKGVMSKWDNSRFHRELGNPVSILMYHRISNDNSTFAVSPKIFEEQMRYLKENGYSVISLDNAVCALSERGSLPPKSIVITFDDGYADFLEAWDVLRAYQFPVTLFLPTAYVGGTNAWETKCMPNKIPILSEEQIRTLIRAGVDVQAHSHQHSYFTCIEPHDIRLEIAENVRQLDALGVQAKYFAYPSGEYTLAASELLREFGFKAALTCVSTPSSCDSDLMTLPRITIENGTMHDFEMRLKYGIGLQYAQEELLEHIRLFRPAKYWHNVPDFDPGKIYSYQQKRPERKT
jgi:glycosyltransferase involved in cell wall biosynthesis